MTSHVFHQVSEAFQDWTAVLGAAHEAQVQIFDFRVASVLEVGRVSQSGDLVPEQAYWLDVPGAFAAPTALTMSAWDGRVRDEVIFKARHGVGEHDQALCFVA
jgi:hypothetical protein